MRAALRVLGIEASTGGVGVALLGAGPDGDVVEARPGPARPAGSLLAVLVSILEREGLSLRHLDGLAVAVGPGSYAGVRAAVATGKALAWAAALPLAAVGSLEAEAWAAMGAWTGAARTGLVVPGTERGVPPQPCLVASALEARRQRVYGAVYEVQGGRLVTRAAPALLFRARWRELVVEAAGRWVEGAAGLCVLAGPGWLPEEVGAMRGAVEARGVRVALPLAGGSEHEAAVPLAVAQLGAYQLQAGQAVDPLRLAPLYISEPDIGAPPPSAMG